MLSKLAELVHISTDVHAHRGISVTPVTVSLGVLNDATESCQGTIFFFEHIKY
jgi:hypothetical protein